MQRLEAASNCRKDLHLRCGRSSKSNLGRLLINWSRMYHPNTPEKKIKNRTAIVIFEETFIIVSTLLNGEKAGNK